MKSEIVNVKETKEIDWSKPQVFIDNLGQIVLSTGKAKDNNTFSGVCIFRGKSSTYEGDYSKRWARERFTPITEPINIKFENE